MGASTASSHGDNSLHAVHAVLPLHLGLDSKPMATACEQAAGRQRKAGSSTLAQLLQASDVRPVQPATLLHVEIDGVLHSDSVAAALREQPANGAVLAQTVPRLLLRDASLQPGTDSVQQYIHSGLQSLFTGPNPRLGPGALDKILGEPSIITILLLLLPR